MPFEDYIEEKEDVSYRLPQKASGTETLASVDLEMEKARKNAQIRGRREALLQQIKNLENQNAELRARRDNIKKNSLSNMDEDQIVAMAKAKGIKNEDIDAWLKGRAQRSAREISGAQTKELERQAEELKEQNKAQDVQAIYDADRDYEEAFERAKYESKDETVASMDKNVLSKKNKLETLKSQFKRRYGMTWEDYTGQPEEEEKLSVTVTEEENGKDEKPKFVKETLTEEEEAVLDEPTLQKFNERDTSNTERREIKAKAQEKLRKKGEAEKARKEKLNDIKGYLRTLGISKGSNVMKILNEAGKTNDPTIRRAVDELRNFLRSDKEFKTYADLKKLL